MKKKRIGIILTIMLLLIAGILVFKYMQRTTYTLKLPKVEDVKSIVLNNENRREVITDVEEIEDIIYVLDGNGRASEKESTNDSPVNIEQLIKLEFNFKDGGTSIAYSYANDGGYYFEQPYNGIYQISGDDYNSIEKYSK